MRLAAPKAPDFAGRKFPVTAHIDFCCILIFDMINLQIVKKPRSAFRFVECDDFFYKHEGLLTRLLKDYARTLRL